MPNATIITRDLNGIALTARADRLPMQLASEGILEAAAFEVTGSSGMAVTVGSGAANADHAVVTGDDASGQGNYIVEMTDATVNVPLSAADGSNPRIDLIVLKVRDDDHDSGGQNLTDVEVVEGTPAASPSVPTLPNSAMPLAEVTVATGTTLIKPAQISDTRTKSYGRGELITTVIFTADGTFTKADYPAARTIIVHAIGAGGGGGGADATAAGQIAVGAGGGGGGYSKQVLNLENVAASVVVSVGTGGAGGVGDAAGSAGGDSSFGSQCVAKGGSGGGRRSATTPIHQFQGADGGQASAGTGAIKVTGGGGGPGIGLATNRAQGGYGGHGAGPFGGGDSKQNLTSTTSGGGAGEEHGGGGSGAANGQSQSAATGGAGEDGRVVIEVYA